MNIEAPDKHITCHDTGHRHKCLKHYKNCWKWIRMEDTNGNGEWGCKDYWDMRSGLETARQIVVLQKDFEELRNELIKHTKALAVIAMRNNGGK